MRHSFEAHSSSPNFSFTCGIDGCSHSFTTFSAVMSHLNRKHKGVDLDSAAFVASSDDLQQSHSYESQSNQLMETSHEEGSLSQCFSYVPDSRTDHLQRSAAIFLLTLKERYEITQSALNFAVGQVQQMITYAVEDMQTTIKQHLQANDVSVDMLDGLSAPDPFNSLQTEYMQTKYYKEHFDLVASCVYIAIGRLYLLV